MRNFLRQPVTIFTIVAIVSAIAGIYYAAQRPEYSGITFISNLAVFLASGLISYLITYNNEREQFSKNMRQLADFAKRRVELLRDNLASLTEVIRLDQDASAGEIKKFVAYTLTNLSEDAEASVYDIEGMGRTDRSTPLVTSNNERKPNSPLAIQPPPARTVDETVSYNCPTCGYSNEASLSSAPGTTKVVICSSCEARSNLHRVASGRYKIVGHSRQAAIALKVRSPILQNPPQSDHQSRDLTFECPRCQNRIGVKGTDGSLVNRVCFNCLASLQYDPSTNKTEITSREPRYVDDIHVRELDCPNCGNRFAPYVHTSKSGQEFIICHRCNTAFLGSGYEKKQVSKHCPDCGAEIRFRTRLGEQEAKQFCFECKKRLALNTEAGTISILEVLKIPKVSFEKFKLGGQKCPHCGGTASLGYTTNSLGERLSVCWACKNVFEFVD